MSNVTKKLYEFVQARPKPEDVAAYILEKASDIFTKEEADSIGDASRHSMKNIVGYFSSMMSDFHRPVGAEKQLAVAYELFFANALSAEDCMDPEKVKEYVKVAGEEIRKSYGVSDFKVNRMNREQRKKSEIMFAGHRAYNKRFRLLRRMEKKIERMIRERIKYNMTRIGKSSFAFDIPYEDFAEHLPTACFVAYMSARMSRRSVFTNGSQSKAYDSIAKTLFDKLKRCPKTRWDVVASVMPTEEVLSRLSDEQKGAMLARTWNLFNEAAGLLKQLFFEMNIDPKTMIVRRGCDSSTWNQVAGGWNKLQENWRSLVISLGMEDLLDKLCVGKVMRLMAADVAYWHRSSGGDIHPATKVWAELPLPWNVISGEATCTRDMVAKACNRFGVDPETWVGAKTEGKAEKFEATPELVNGVVVSSPSLAKALKKARVFSGKTLKGLVDHDFEVARDENGFAIEAKETVKV